MYLEVKQIIFFYVDHNISLQNRSKQRFRYTSFHLHYAKALKGHVDFQRIKKINRYFEFCNLFPRIENLFSLIIYSVPRIRQSFFSGCNSFPQFQQFVILDCNSLTSNNSMEQNAI